MRQYIEIIRNCYCIGTANRLRCVGNGLKSMKMVLVFLRLSEMSTEHQQLYNIQGICGESLVESEEQDPKRNE